MPHRQLWTTSECLGGIYTKCGEIATVLHRRAASSNQHEMATNTPPDLSIAFLILDWLAHLLLSTDKGVS